MLITARRCWLIVLLPYFRQRPLVDWRRWTLSRIGEGFISLCPNTTNSPAHSQVQSGDLVESRIHLKMTWIKSLQAANKIESSMHLHRFLSSS